MFPVIRRKGKSFPSDLASANLPAGERPGSTLQNTTDAPSSRDKRVSSAAELL
jgi:hypothetical protein